MTRELDQAADSMRATMAVERRKLEDSGAMLCASCEQEANPDSCYCKRCDDEIYF